MSVIKLRGLPWSVTKNDIIKFLDDVKIVNGENSIHLLTTSEGRLSGEAYVEVETEDCVENALKHDNALMGQRYIEIFKATHEQMMKSLEQSNNTTNWTDPIVRLRGLPFNCSNEELAKFFDGLQISPNGILMVIDFSGRFNGEAFVQFTNIDDAYKALDNHKKMMGHRYIEIFRTSLSEMEYYETNSNFIKLNKMFKEAMNGSYGGGGGGGGGTSSYQSNNFSSKRPTPYSKPQNRNNRGNSASNMIPSLLDNISNEQNNVSSIPSGGNTSLPSLFDFQFPKSSDTYNPQNVIKMRGLPYSVNVNDIKEFFKPLTPLNINLLFGDDGRLSGEAEVEFSTTDDTNEALKYDRRYIGTRYIELFLLSNNDANNRNKSNYSSNNSNDRSSIPSLFNQIAYLSTQQFMNQNFSNDNDYNSSNSYNNYSNRRQFNNKRGGGMRNKF